MNIKQNTREAARRTVRNLRASGKVCNLIDNGKHLQGCERWIVALTGVTTPIVKPSRIVKRHTRKFNNRGFDIRPLTSGVKGYDVYLDGEFLIRRDTKITAYSDALALAHKNGINTQTLCYK